MAFTGRQPCGSYAAVPRCITAGERGVRSLLSRIMEHVEPALALETAEGASTVYFAAMESFGASYLQTRLYRRPTATLTSARHWAAGGFITRLAPADWPGSPAFDYVCFECNPLLGAIRESRTRYLRWHCEHHLYYEPTRLNVDLHWALALREFAVPENVIARNIGADIEIFGKCRQPWIARVRARDQRARLGVALAVKQEVGAPIARQDADIGLHVAGGDRRGVARIAAGANGAARRAWVGAIPGDRVSKRCRHLRLTFRAVRGLNAAA